MKITLHKKIAEYFGYEFVKISRMAYRDANSHLMRLFELLHINCVFDVGANMGQYAEYLRKIGYQGLIVSFEPVSQCYEYIKRLENEKWKIVNVGLGKEAALVDINVAKKTVFSSFLEPNDYSVRRFHESASIERHEKVKVERLDDVINQLIQEIKEPCIFLKLDTQGYDLEVLKGANKSLQYIAGIQTEISCKAIYKGMPTHIESLTYLHNLGYEITNIFPLSHDKNDMSLLEFDCILRKK